MKKLLHAASEYFTELQQLGRRDGIGAFLVFLYLLEGDAKQTGMSDLAIVLGGAIGSSNKTSDNQLSGFLWSASSDANADVRTVRYDGGRYDSRPYERLAGARPALPSSVASSIKPSEARLTRKIGDVQVVEFGEYPQTIVAEAVNRELEQAFSRGQLQKTGKTYTFELCKDSAIHYEVTEIAFVENEEKTPIIVSDFAFFNAI